MSTAVILGQVGVQYPADGTNPPLRQGKAGELIVSELQPRFYEQNYRGNLFMLDSQSVTIAAAHATKTAMATAKLINGFYNPANSGKNAILVSANVATTSGTPGGAFLYNYFNLSPMITAAAGTIVSGIVGGSQKSAMTPQVSTVLTASDADTSALTQLGVLGGPAAVAAGAGVYNAFDAIDGKIIVPPGCCFGICSTATGTSHVVQSTLVWIEALI